MKYYIGVDLGGTNIAAGLVDENFKIIYSSSVRTNLPRPAEEVEVDMAQLCRDVAIGGGISIEDVDCIGIGTPGSVNPVSGMVIFNTNFGYHNWRLTENLEKLLPCKCYIENDANAAAFGEYKAGAAQGANPAVVVTLGTGIGCGVVIDGKIFSGFNYAGAELGHTVIVKDGRPCTCGRNGCFEKYASSRALAEDTAAAMRENPDNMMWGLVQGDITKVNAKTAFDGMRAGDALATQVVNTFLDYVACGITNIVNTFQPEILCIGGGISKEGETLLEPVRERMDKEEYNRTGTQRTKLVTARLRNDAGIIGAALLGTQKR